MRQRRPLHPALAFLALSALSLGAQAHTGEAGHAHAGWLAGWTHPFTGLDHLAAMVAVGLWSALSARAGEPLHRCLWSPAWFAALLLAGALLGLGGLRLAGVEPMIAASLLVTGLLAASRLALPRTVAALAVGGFALFHGLAHGTELPPGQAALTLLGLLMATATLHGAGLAAGWALRRQVWLPRLAGASVAVLGGASLWPLVG